MTEKKQKPLRDYSRSSTGISPAEKNRQVVAEGIRRAAAEIDYRNDLQTRHLRRR